MGHSSALPPELLATAASGILEAAVWAFTTIPLVVGACSLDLFAVRGGVSLISFTGMSQG
jgi:hypothetical protein